MGKRAQFHRLHKQLTRSLLLYFNFFGHLNLNKYVVPSKDELIELRRLKGTTTSSETQQQQQQQDAAAAAAHKPDEAKDATGKRPAERYSTWWANFCLVIYIYISLKMTTTVYFQYQYDFHVVKLQRLNELGLHKFCNSTSENKLTFCPQELAKVWMLKTDLQQQADSSRRILKLLGAPHINCHMLNECNLILLMFITHLSYIAAKLKELKRPFDMHFVCMIMNPELELVRCRRLVESQAMEIVDSSANAIVALIHRIQDCERLVMDIFRTTTKARRTTWDYHFRQAYERNNQQFQSRISTRLLEHKDADLGAALEDHGTLRRLVSELLSGDQLMPINRSHEWIDSKSLQFSLNCLGQIVYSLFLNVSALALLPNYTGSPLELASLMDKLAFFELLFFILISVNSCIFFLVLLSANASDLARYLKHVQVRFLACISENNEILKRLNMGMLRSRHQLDLDRLNVSLCHSILEYRIFVVQFKPIQRTFSFITIVIYLVVFVVPIMIRVHSSYCAPTIWLFGTLFSFTTLALTNTISFPICLIHKQGQRLYKIMSHMLAQTIELNLDLSQGSQKVYNEHLVWLLRRTLEDPKHFTDQFASKALPGVLLTFGRLTQFHYLYSLVLFSTFFQMNSWRRLFGSRLDDPFGLYEGLTSGA